MNANPMQRANAALTLHPRCGAYCRTTGQACRTPAMPNGRCRMHGGKSTGAPRGPAHPRYKHGRRSRSEIESKRKTRLILRTLRSLIEQAEGS